MGKCWGTALARACQNVTKNLLRRNSLVIMNVVIRMICWILLICNLLIHLLNNYDGPTFLKNMSKFATIFSYLDDRSLCLKVLATVKFFEKLKRGYFGSSCHFQLLYVVYTLKCVQRTLCTGLYDNEELHKTLVR